MKSRTTTKSIKKKRLTRPQLRARAMQAALNHPDPWVARDLEHKFVFKYLTADALLVDDLGFRRGGNWRESPLQATYRFAEELRAAQLDPEFGWDEADTTDLGPIWEWSLENIRYVWTARQMAEALKVPFKDYVRAVCLGHLADGWPFPPFPQIVASPEAVARVATYRS